MKKANNRRNKFNRISTQSTLALAVAGASFAAMTSHAQTVSFTGAAYNQNFEIGRAHV